MLKVKSSDMHYQWSEIVFFIGFVVYIATRGKFAHRTKANEKVVRRVDWTEVLLLSLVFIGNLLLPVVYLFTPLLRFANYSLPSAAPWCGTITLAASLWLFWRSHVDLGANWSATLEIRKGHELITRGVYRLIRHPMYLAILLFGLAQGLLLPNWLAGWLALGTFLLLYVVRFPREEQMMREQFGQAYDDYARRTGRLIPRLF